MALDGSIPLVEVRVGQFLDQAGVSDWSGTITFTPMGRRLHASSGDVLTETPIVCPVTDGAGSVMLVASDAPGMSPTNAIYYRVNWALQDRNGMGVDPGYPKMVLLRQAEPVVDLDRLSPVIPGNPVDIPPVIVDPGNGGGVPLDSPVFTGTPRAPRWATNPVTLTAVGGAITPDAAQSMIFRHSASANVQVNEPAHPVDGQLPLWLTILAVGADRTVSFAGGGIAPIVVPNGSRWVGELLYDGSASTYLLIDNAGSGGGGGGGGTGGAVSSVQGKVGAVVLNADDIPDGGLRKTMTAGERTKLAGIANGATVNAADVDLRNRATHTGTQPVSSLATTGSASSSTYLRGDGTWSALSGVQASIVDAKGDLIAATAADAVARLPVGSNGQVLTAASGEATGLAWATPTGSGAGSIKAWEDANRAIAAKAPSAESGLAPAAINNSTDDAPRYQTMLNYLASTYGGGTLYVPPGTSIMNSGITIPSGVQIVGSEKSKWDFFFASDSVVALTITADNYTAIRGLWINGKQQNAHRGDATTTAQVGLRIHGARLSFESMRISGFNQGIDITENDTYILAFDKCYIDNNKVGLNADINNSFSQNPGGPSSNSGERISFTNSLFSNSGTGFMGSSSGLSLHFTNTSFDFINLFGRIRDAHVFFTNCHLETTGVPSGAPSSSGGTRLAYLFDMDFASRLSMDSCNFIMGSQGVYYVVNGGTASPGYYAMAHFDGCHVYNIVPTGVTATRAEFSEQVFPVTAGQTTITVASMFITKWNTIKVNVVAWNGQPAANVTARITAIDHTNGTVTVTLSGAAPSNTFIELDC